MRKMIVSVALALVSVSATASCLDLKAKLDKQLQDKGVQSYALDIVDAERVEAALAASAKAAAASSSPTAQPGKVIGSCEGDSKRIIYRRN